MLSPKIKIYIIAGEASGDNIGGQVMQQLSLISPGQFIFRGIGGKLMQQQGLDSIFPMEQISLMGFIEILPHIFKLKHLINKTITDILNWQPNIIITIDSPGFNLRVTKAVKAIEQQNMLDGAKDSNAKLIHIVAPSVWAYKPERARKFALIYDLMLALLPFEPPYFEREGLATRFIGHPIFEAKPCTDKLEFRTKYHIPPNAKVVCITPGSRVGEVKRHLVTFLDALNLLQQKLSSKLYVIIVAASRELMYLMEKYISAYPNFSIQIIESDKFAAYKTADVVLAKSGTNTLEIAMHNTPFIVAYKLNLLTWWYIKYKIRIKFASLLNIAAGYEVIPEFLQQDCNPPQLATKLFELLTNDSEREEQIKNMQAALITMGCNTCNSPSKLAAEYIIQVLSL